MTAGFSFTFMIQCKLILRKFKMRITFQLPFFLNITRKGQF